jgi:hypothetical protein
MRSLASAMAFVGCLLLSSCFDIREEIWIESDGSGRAELEYVIPSSALGLGGGEELLRKEVQRLIDSEPDLHLDSLAVSSNGKDSTISLKVSIDSMLSLISMQDNEVFRSMPESASGFIGEFDVSLAGLTVDFKRRIDLKGTLGLASLAISKDQREQRRLYYAIHLPNEAASHTATEVADEGRTLIWDYSLAQALSSPIDTNFRARIPIPWWLYAAFTSLLALFIWAIIKVRKGRLRKRSTGRPQIGTESQSKQ